MKFDFRAEMIECAYRYFNSIECSSFKPMDVHVIICCLSIEIILKSFSAKEIYRISPDDAIYSFDKHKVDNAHDLISLTNALEPEIRNYLFNYNDIEILHNHRNTFSTSRYLYEKNAESIFSDDIIKLTVRLLCKTVYLYRLKGCKHPFIDKFNIENTYHAYTQIDTLENILLINKL